MLKIYRILFLLLITAQTVLGQKAFDSKDFFTTDTVLYVTLATDLRNLIREKVNTEEQKAIFSVKMPDGDSVSEEIRLNARGELRRKVCNIPPLRLNFRNSTSPRLKSLKSLKLVNSCRGGSSDEQLVLKEFLIYKMFNLLTENSFRVRLLYMTYEDINGKKKSNTQYAFFIEDIDALAKRNNSKELNNMKLNTSTCNIEQMLLVDIFQYMIGNTDWSVPNNHNIKLILEKNTSNVKPLVIPYDFDFAGLVDADYAAPAPIMEIETVTQRVYRGFPHTMEELQSAIQVFNQQKENIYTLVNTFDPLTAGNKKWIINYLDDFYKTINNERKVKSEFIDNARKQ